MSSLSSAQDYPPAEERINISSHAIGLILSLIATVLLVIKALDYGGALPLISFTVFGLSLITLYAASTLYHSQTNPQRRARFRVLDHASIYLLIAGTYTPFMLITLANSVGWIIFAVSWVMAVIGIVIKLFFTGRFKLLSTLMYLFMGWMIVFAMKPLMESISAQGLWWLIAGGIAYTIGAVLYSIKRLPFNHAIFHIFVLLGSSSHFIAVYRYTLIPVE